MSTDTAAPALFRERVPDTRPRHVPRGDDDPHTAHHNRRADPSATGMYMMASLFAPWSGPLCIMTPT